MLSRAAFWTHRPPRSPLGRRCLVRRSGLSVPVATIIDQHSRLDLILFQLDRADLPFDQDADGLHLARFWRESRIALPTRMARRALRESERRPCRVPGRCQRSRSAPSDCDAATSPLTRCGRTRRSRRSDGPGCSGARCPSPCARSRFQTGRSPRGGCVRTRRGGRASTGKARRSRSPRHAVTNDGPLRATARMQPEVGVVLADAVRDRHVVGLLEADAVAVVVPHDAALDDGPKPR